MDSTLQRIVTLAGDSRDVGAVSEELCDSQLLVTPGSSVQRCLAEAVRRVDGGALLDEQLQARLAAFESGVVQWRGEVLVSGVHVCPGFYQQCCHLVWGEFLRLHIRSKLLFIPFFFVFVFFFFVLFFLQFRSNPNLTKT